MPATTSPESEVRAILIEWATAMREGHQDAVLQSHATDARLFDVLPPLQYTSAAAYRASWGDWQPATECSMVFEWEDLQVTAGPELAFAHGLIRCGGTLADGRTFQDLVRATFCLRRLKEGWRIVHQHVSKPQPLG